MAEDEGAQSERARRVGANEAIFREVNEQIDGLDRGMAEISDGTLHLVCECGNLDCTERLVVPATEYEAVRSDSTRFFLRPGHQKPALERVVADHGSWLVVDKLPGPGEQVAEEQDPRSG